MILRCMMYDWVPIFALISTVRVSGNFSKTVRWLWRPARRCMCV